MAAAPCSIVLLLVAVLHTVVESVPIQNQFTLIAKDSNSTCGDKVFCPDGYLCYKPLQ
jgi:hypothetical protein